MGPRNLPTEDFYAIFDGHSGPIPSHLSPNLFLFHRPFFVCISLLIYYILLNLHARNRGGLVGGKEPPLEARQSSTASERLHRPKGSPFHVSFPSSLFFTPKKTFLYGLTLFL